MARRPPWFSVVIAVLWLAMVTTCAAQEPFDAASLKTIPAVDVVELATHDYRTALEVTSLRPGVREELKRRTLAAIAAYPPKVRGLFWLVFGAEELGDGHDDTHQVLHFFFALWGGDYAPEIEAAMREAGFAERAQVFADAMTMFGTPYPRDWRRRYQRYGWATPSKNFNAFDLQLIALGKGFGSQAAFERAIDAYVANDAELSAWCDKARAALTDRDRLVNLVTRLDAFAGSREPSVFLKWSEPYRTLQILEISLLELTNGGGEQFFTNFSGDTAPEAVAAYRAIGLQKAADALAKGIGYYPSPYPRRSEARLAAERHDPALAGKLDALTEDIGEGTSEKMIAYAKSEGVLPR